MGTGNVRWIESYFREVEAARYCCRFPHLTRRTNTPTEQEQPGKAPFIGATGGRVDEGEDIEAAARRELLEESGYEADELILWDAQQPLSKIEWAVYTFVARGLRKVADLDLDPGEKIKLKPTTLDELIELAQKGYFVEKEVVIKLLEAKLYPKKKVSLEKLFSA